MVQASPMRKLLVGLILVLGMRAHACTGWDIAIQGFYSVGELVEKLDSASHLPELVRAQLKSAGHSIENESQKIRIDFVNAVAPYLNPQASSDDIRGALKAAATRYAGAPSESLAKHFLGELDTYLGNPAYRGALIEVGAAFTAFSFSSLHSEKTVCNDFFETQSAFLSAEIDASDWQFHLKRLFTLKDKAT